MKGSPEFPEKRSLPLRKGRGVGPTRLSSAEEWQKVMEAPQLLYKQPGNKRKLNDLSNKKVEASPDTIFRYIPTQPQPSTSFRKEAARRPKDDKRIKLEKEIMSKTKGTQTILWQQQVVVRPSFCQQQEQQSAQAPGRLSSQDRAVLNFICDSVRLEGYLLSDPTVTETPVLEGEKGRSVWLDLNKVSQDEIQSLAKRENERSKLVETREYALLEDENDGEEDQAEAQKGPEGGLIEYLSGVEQRASDARIKMKNKSGSTPCNIVPRNRRLLSRKEEASCSGGVCLWSEKMIGLLKAVVGQVMRSGWSQATVKPLSLGSWGTVVRLLKASECTEISSFFRKLGAESIVSKYYEVMDLSVPPSLYRVLGEQITKNEKDEALLLKRAISDLRAEVEKEMRLGFSNPKMHPLSVLFWKKIHRSLIASPQKETSSFFLEQSIKSTVTRYYAWISVPIPPSLAEALEQHEADGVAGQV